MNGEFLRGEVYWVSVDDSVGSEIRTGRPAVIVSGDGENSKSETVIVAYMTHSDVIKKWSRVVCYVNGVPQVVCCEQLRTVDKKRLTAYKGCLSKEDMVRVTGALASALCVPLRPNVTERKPDSAEVQKLRVELDMYKGMYELVLRQLISERVSNDLGYSSEDEDCDDEYETDEESEYEEPEYEEEEPSEDETLIDINSCTKIELVKNLGISSTSAHSIVANRPYKAVSDLRTVPGVTKIAYRLLKSKVVCVVESEEVEEPKLNINTASAKELSALTGLSENLMYAITGYRKRNGEYKSVSELSKVERLPANFLERFGDKLMV